MEKYSNKKRLLSFVIPCYGSQYTIKNVVNEIKETVKLRKEFEYEIILISDSSPDNVFNVICELAENDKHIKGVRFAKNFGQHAATLAGYKYCKGDIVITLDDDGQTPADELFSLVDKIDEGVDVAFARYPIKQHNMFRRFVSKINVYMMEVLVNKPRGLAANSYFAAKRFVITEVLKYENPYPYLAGLIFRTTKNCAHVDVKHRARKTGHSGYSLLKLWKLWMNGFTAFSVKPLQISSYIGIITAIIGFIYSIIVVVRRIGDPTIPVGYSSLMAVMLFLGGLILLMLGLVGEYVGRVYICINQSPQYVVCQTVNIENNE